MNSLLSKELLKKSWPSDISPCLDQFVACLFCQTRSKIAFSLVNKSQMVLVLDLVIPQMRKELLTLVLQEFETLVLDIIEAELSLKDLCILNQKILYDLICKSGDKFIDKILHINYKSHLKVDTKDLYFKSMLKDSKVILGNLIIYLLFGTSQFVNISFQYVESLLHNLIIKVGDLVLYLLFSKRTMYKVVYQISALYSNTMFHPKSWSIRSMEQLQNNIIYQSLKYFYIDQPKAIYSNRYRVIILSSHGILEKTILVDRVGELNNLSYSQLLLPNLLEIQDFLMPKFKRIVFIAGRIVIYIGFSIINNLLLFFFHVVIRGLVKLAEDS